MRGAAGGCWVGSCRAQERPAVPFHSARLPDENAPAVQNDPPTQVPGDDEWARAVTDRMPQPPSPMPLPQAA
ncbi:hypothetical protein Cma02nite_10080 [Cellulomonas marina]|nr:hypothetical protein Cma02nite_10080 [Cellulomonas marina]